MEQNNQWVEERLSKLTPEPEWEPHVTTALARFEQRRAHRLTGARVIIVTIVAGICLLTFPAPRALAQRALAPCIEACENLAFDPGDLHYRLHRMIWTFHSWLGLTTPDFALTDSKGVNFQLSDYAGKIVLLNFWATWCKPCQEETPWFVEFQRNFGDNGLAVIGVSLDDDGWKSVRPFMESQKINYRIAIGDSDVAQRFGDTLPFTMLIDRDGRPLVKHSGMVDKKQYEREIVRALNPGLGQAERDRLRAQGL